MPALKKDRSDIWAIVLCYAAVVLAAFIKPVHFEPIEFGSIVQILHPEHPKGGLIYQPNYNYNFLMAAVIRWLSLGEDWGAFIRWYWIVEMLVTVAVLLKISGFVFKRDALISVIFVMSYIFYRSGELDPKTLALPFYFGAVYCLLRNRWGAAGICAGIMFYIHIGMAVWLLLPSLFGLVVIGRKDCSIPLKSAVLYAAAAGLTALPVIFYYIAGTGSQEFNQFVVRYFYIVCGITSSVTLLVKQAPLLIAKLVLSAVVGWGCYRAGKDGFPSVRIGYILYGVIAVYFLNWILADVLFIKTVIFLQLLRSYLFVQFFALLFLAYFLSRQIRAGNFIFFVPYMLIWGAYRFVSESALVLFSVLILLFDVFGKRAVYPKIVWNAAQRPALIAGLFCLIMTMHLPFFKTAIKAGLGVQKSKDAVSLSKDEYLYQDMAGFVNNIADRNVLVVYPFQGLDYLFFSHQKTFWDAYSPVHQIQYSSGLADFKAVFEKDLKLSLDKIAQIGFDSAWAQAWENLPEETVLRWHKEYGVTHIIRDKELPYNLPVVYENEYFRLYRLGK